jgi:hypothetical protein
MTTRTSALLAESPERRGSLLGSLSCSKARRSSPTDHGRLSVCALTNPRSSKVIMHAESVRQMELRWRHFEHLRRPIVASAVQGFSDDRVANEVAVTQQQ